MRRLVPVLGAVALLCGCASTNERLDYDPLEGMNRKIFAFNLAARHNVLDPIGRVWHAVLPDRAERAVSNFFQNILFPIDLANNLLQGKPVRAVKQTARFAVNTTVGIGGLFDPATRWGMPDYEEDFGQTLAVWGFASGPYLVLPLYGPSNFREGVGLIGDYYGSLQPMLLDNTTYYALYGINLVNADALDLDASARRRAAAIDYYIFVRNAFMQNRQSKARDEPPLSESQQQDLYDVDTEDDQ